MDFNGNANAYRSDLAPRDSVNGVAMQALRIKARATLQRLETSRELQPCTIVNFNPIELRVDDQHIEYTVQAHNSPVGGKVEILYKGVKYLGSYVTDKNARLAFPMREGEKNPHDVMSILPSQKVRRFYDEYNATNAQMVGGVLIYQGHISALQGKEKEILFPVAKQLADRTFTYVTEPRSIHSMFDEIFGRQRAYCERRVAHAHKLYQDPLTKNEISDVDRAWAGFALEHEWITEAPKWDPDFSPVAVAKCVGCGTAKNEAAFFCGCGRPYDAHAAYMAGEDVAPVHLANLKGEQLADVRKEMANRKKLLAELGA